MRTSPWILVAALLPVPSAAFAADPPAAPAGPAKLVVATELVSNEMPPKPPTPDAKEPARVVQGANTVDFDEAVPAGVTALPASAGHALYGTLKLGDTTHQFAVVLGDKRALDFYADANHDGKFDPATEKQSATPGEWQERRQVFGTEWKVTGARLGSGTVLVTVREKAADFTGQLAFVVSRPGERPVPPTPLRFAQAKPEAVAKAPDLAGKVTYATAKAGGKDLVFAAVRGEGDALTVFLDDSGKGDMTAAQKLPMAATPMTRGKKRLGTRWIAERVAVGGATASIQVMEALDLVLATVNAPGTRRGSADVGSKPYELFLMDGDMDGSFNGPEDWWWFGPEKANPRPNLNNMFEGNEACLGDADAWRLVSVGPDGSATVERVTGPVAVEEYLHRRSERVNAKRWFPRFEEDKEFAKLRSLDTSRPKAEKPAAFHYALDLASAKAIAAREGKPLLVDFEADWCIWCKRLDYYTYPDKDVVAALGRFTAVKINNELDPQKSFKAMTGPDGKPWGGIPALAIFAPDGNPLPFAMPTGEGEGRRPTDHIPGWMKPEAFVKALDAAYQAWEDAKAGKPPVELPKPGAPTMPKEPKAPVEPKKPDEPAPPAQPR